MKAMIAVYLYIGISIGISYLFLFNFLLFFISFQNEQKHWYYQLLQHG